MRFNRRIHLIVEPGRKRYNPKTSREERLPDKAMERPCYLTSISLDRSMQVFGEYRKEVLVAQLQGRLTKKVDLVKVDDKKYRVLKTVLYRNRTSLFLETAHED